MASRARWSFRAPRERSGNTEWFRAQDEGNKLRLRNQTELARTKGIFGAPTFFVGEDMFWGNDRLDDALACCRAQGAR